MWKMPPMRLQYRGATATVARQREWDVDYRGPLCRSAALHLGRYVRGLTGNDPLIERLNRSVILTGTEPFQVREVSYLVGTKPGAIICRPDQLETMTGFCEFLATIGVIRLAFLDDALAQDWLECLE